MNNGITVTLPDGRLHDLYVPTPKQAQAHALDVPNLLAVGSRGSGKSIWLRNDAHMRALSVPGCNLVLIRRTFPELTMNHIHPLKAEMKMLGGYYHATDHIAHYPNGSKLFLSYVGSDDGMNLLGGDFLAGYFDELSVIPWEFFRKLSASIRTTIPGLKAVVRAATNPLGGSAYMVNKYFVTKDVDPIEDSDYLPGDWGHIVINMEDNPHLDLDQYRKRFAGLPEHIKKAWLHGEYMEDSSLFRFEATREGKPYHIINEVNVPELLRAGRIYRAFDWGWYPDPSYCLWIAHVGNRYIAFHEKTWYQTTAPDIAREIKELDREMGIEHTVTTFCDPSIDVHHGNICTTKDLFEIHGIPMENSVNNREMAATAIHRALGEESFPGVPKLQIYNGPGGCHYLAKSIPQMRYDTKNPLSIANHKDDHPVITLAYYLMSTLAMDAPAKSQPGQVPRWMQPKKSNTQVLGHENVRSSKSYS